MAVEGKNFRAKACQQTQQPSLVVASGSLGGQGENRRLPKDFRSLGILVGWAESSRPTVRRLIGWQKVGLEDPAHPTRSFPEQPRCLPRKARRTGPDAGRWPTNGWPGRREFAWPKRSGPWDCKNSKHRCRYEREVADRVDAART